MDITKEQRRVFWKTVIKICEQHKPSLDSYLWFQLPNVMKHHPKMVTPENFIPKVPEMSLTPRSQTVLKGNWAQYHQTACIELQKLRDEERPAEKPKKKSKKKDSK